MFSDSQSLRAWTASLAHFDFDLRHLQDPSRWREIDSSCNKTQIDFLKKKSFSMKKEPEYGYPPTPACKGERALRRVFGTTRTTTTTSTLTSTTRTRTKTRRRTRTRTTTRTTTTTTPAAAATTTTTRPKWGDVWYTERPVHVFPFWGHEAFYYGFYSICMETTKNVIQLFVLVHFGAMCAAGFAGNAVQNHGFVCRKTTKSWNETLSFLEDSDARFWHRRWGKSGSKMAFGSRPGYAVCSFCGLVSWGPRGFLLWFLQHLQGNHPKMWSKYSC